LLPIYASTTFTIVSIKTSLLLFWNYSLLD
jgi:hypothetical protein